VFICWLACERRRFHKSDKNLSVTTRFAAKLEAPVLWLFMAFASYSVAMLLLLLLLLLLLHLYCKICAEKWNLIESLAPVKN
jgi:hypothetical protein